MIRCRIQYGAGSARMKRTYWIVALWLACLIIAGCSDAVAQGTLPSREHLTALARRLAKEQAKIPLPIRQHLTHLVAEKETGKATALLASIVLLEVDINPESRVKLRAGAARAQIRSREAVLFLVRISNASGVTAPLRLTAHERPVSKKGALTLRLEGIEKEGDPAKLHGQPVEYVLLRALCTEPGSREVILTLDVGQGTQDLGFRSEVPILFRCQKIHEKKSSPRTIKIIHR